MMSQQCVPVACTSIAVGGVTGIKLPVPSGTVPANVVLIVCETGPIRIRDDATSATPSVGMLIQPTMPSPFEYSGNFNSLTLCGVTGTVAVDLAYYALRG